MYAMYDICAISGVHAMDAIHVIYASSVRDPCNLLDKRVPPSGGTKGDAPTPHAPLASKGLVSYFSQGSLGGIVLRGSAHARRSSGHSPGVSGSPSRLLLYLRPRRKQLLTVFVSTPRLETSCLTPWLTPWRRGWTDRGSTGACIRVSVYM